MNFGEDYLLHLDFTAMSKKGKPTIYNWAPTKNGQVN